MDKDKITRHSTVTSASFVGFTEDEGAISVSLDGAVEMQLDESWMLG